VPGPGCKDHADRPRLAVVVLESSLDEPDIVGGETMLRHLQHPWIAIHGGHVQPPSYQLDGCEARPTTDLKHGRPRRKTSYGDEIVEHRRRILRPSLVVGFGNLTEDGSSIHGHTVEPGVISHVTSDASTNTPLCMVNP
jgi:hypothetical protein